MKFHSNSTYRELYIMLHHSHRRRSVMFVSVANVRTKRPPSQNYLQMSFWTKGAILVVVIAALLQYFDVSFDSKVSERQRRAPIATTGFTPCMKCIDFGYMTNIGAIVFGDFVTASNVAGVNVDGALFVGGNATFGPNQLIRTNYTGTAPSTYTAPTCKDMSLVVKGKITNWPSGYVGSGSIVSGVACQVPGADVIDPAGCCVFEDSFAFDFNNAYNSINSLSKCISTYPSTVASKTVDQAGRQVFTMQNITDHIQTSFYFVTADDLSVVIDFANLPVIANADPDTPIVFNIPGKNITITNANQASLRFYMVFMNFFEAEEVHFHASDIRANILAQNARVYVDGLTQIYGALVALFLEGENSAIHSAPRYPACAMVRPAIILPQINCANGVGSVTTSFTSSVTLSTATSSSSSSVASTVTGGTVATLVTSSVATSTATAKVGATTTKAAVSTRVTSYVPSSTPSATDTGVPTSGADGIFKMSAVALSVLSILLMSAFIM